ncbi:MAG: NUDIX hydrolase [Bacillota bacterium]
MSYIAELRALIGHRPLVLAGACAIVLDERDRLLMQRRTDSGAWGVPGGCTEVGETTEDTAIRETAEETGLEVGGLVLFGVFSGLATFHRYPNGDEVWNVTVAYLTRYFHGEVSPRDGEGLEARFFDLEALPEDTAPPIRPILGRLVEARRAGLLPR